MATLTLHSVTQVEKVTHLGRCLIHRNGGGALQAPLVPVPARQLLLCCLCCIPASNACSRSSMAKRDRVSCRLSEDQEAGVPRAGSALARHSVSALKAEQQGSVHRAPLAAPLTRRSGRRQGPVSWLPVEQQLDAANAAVLISVTALPFCRADKRSLSSRGWPASSRARGSGGNGQRQQHGLRNGGLQMSLDCTTRGSQLFSIRLRPCRCLSTPSGDGLCSRPPPGASAAVC